VTVRYVDVTAQSDSTKRQFDAVAVQSDSVERQFDDVTFEDADVTARQVKQTTD